MAIANYYLHEEMQCIKKRKKNQIGNRIELQLQYNFLLPPLLIVAKSRLDYLRCWFFFYFARIYQLHFRLSMFCPECSMRIGWKTSDGRVRRRKTDELKYTKIKTTIDDPQQLHQCNSLTHKQTHILCSSVSLHD